MGYMRPRVKEQIQNKSAMVQRWNLVLGKPDFKFPLSFTLSLHLLLVSDEAVSAHTRGKPAALHLVGLPKLPTQGVVVDYF